MNLYDENSQKIYNHWIQLNELKSKTDQKIYRKFIKKQLIYMQNFFKISWLNKASSERFIIFIIVKTLIQTLYNNSRFLFSWKLKTKKFFKFSVLLTFILIICAIIYYVIKNKNEDSKNKINFKLIDDDDTF